MCCCQNKVVHLILGLLLVVGGLNWGLVGLGSFLDMNLNLVNLLFGSWMVVENIVYLLVGLAAVLMAIFAIIGKCGEECECK
ncbi:MAG: DUF378 domain-containing protein [Candidatus Gracilibacteria bacterium]|nr:DUF378 domain-containing protein [Candidatus Gracilibacteria bacterium]